MSVCVCVCVSGDCSTEDNLAPTDPSYSEQWHLHNGGAHGGVRGIDLNVAPVWKELRIYGTSVQIAVVDDGLQFTHPDLSCNYVAEDSYDVNDGDDDPMPHPRLGDDHGTSAAGAAAARDETTCGVGAAFRARLSGVRLLSAMTTDLDEATALAYHMQVCLFFLLCVFITSCVCLFLCVYF